MIGHGLDDRYTAPWKGSKKIVVVDNGISLREFSGDDHKDEEHEEGEDHHDEDGLDPHYWLSIENSKQITQTIASELSQINGINADEVEKSKNEYIEQLDKAQEQLMVIASNVTNKNFISMHNAWQYFAQEFGFNLVGTYEPQEGREPSIADIARLKEIISEFGITAFYAEPQKSSSSAISFIERDLGLSIRELDPVGGISPDDSYIKLLTRNVEAIAQGGK